MEEGDESNSLVFFDIKIDEEKIGRVIIELYNKIVPKTVANFLSLCVGDHGLGSTGNPLHYKGTIFHKVVRGVFIQGGDVTHGNGSGGESIYGLHFEDENYKLKHNAPGMLSTVNSGQNRNNSQFIITTSECPHLDGSCVVFGKVIKGLNCIVQVSEVKTKEDFPLPRCVIENCGRLHPGDPWNYVDCDGTDDNFPPDPADLEIPFSQLDPSCMMDIVVKIKMSGNHFFLKYDYIEADRKYRKALRYIDMFLANATKISEETGADEKMLVNELEREKISCTLNSSATTLKKGLYRETLNLCDEVLKKEKTNAKAYFRRGKALMCLNDYEGALLDQKRALSLAPNNKSITDEINSIQNTIKSYLVQEKKIFSKMFHSYK